MEMTLALLSRQLSAVTPASQRRLAGQITNRANVILERHVSPLKSGAVVDLRSADPIHSKMTEIVARRVPSY